MGPPSFRLVANGPGEFDGADAASTGAIVTGTMLANLVRCEERVRLDIHGDPGARASVSGFVEMLWSQGSRHERRIFAHLPGSVVDLSDVPISQRSHATRLALESAADWILGARLEFGDMEGRPDLLHRVDGVWIAGDIRSGNPLAVNGRDPRLEYGVQVGFYAMMLEALGLGDGDRAFVVGGDGVIVDYAMRAPCGRDGATLHDVVADLLDRARAIRNGRLPTRPASSAACGLCVWRASCKERLRADGDLTLIPGLGRSIRAKLQEVAPRIADLAQLDLDTVALSGGRTSVAGVRADRLTTFRERARMLVSQAPPFATRDLGLSRRDVEHHLDLETDPTCEDGDFTYLHGIWRRRKIDGGELCDYVHFLAKDFAEEREAFAAAVTFLTAEPDALLTTFSAFERTTYRRLSRRYPDVIDEAGIEEMFARGRCVDLYFDAVLPATHWPVESLGLKSIARHLGFDWSASDASGAASIQWFVDWTRTGDPALLERILTYNKEDCIASAVVFDGLLALPVSPTLAWPRGESRP